MPVNKIVNKSAVVTNYTELEQKVIDAMKWSDADIKERALASFYQGIVLEAGESPDDIYFDEYIVKEWFDKNYDAIKHLLTV